MSSNPNDHNQQAIAASLKNLRTETAAGGESDFNQQLIAEFRAHGGKVGGQYANAPLLLLTTTGARSGQLRTAPLGYDTYEDRIIIVASHNGAPRHPDWYRNLIAHPEATVEVGSEQFRVRAIVLEGEAREQVWNMVVKHAPFVVAHQEKTARQIPLVALERIG